MVNVFKILLAGAVFVGSSIRAAEVDPPSPIPVGTLIRVKVAEDEKVWILRSDFEAVDVQWASAERLLLWTGLPNKDGTPGRYAVLTWIADSPGEVTIVEIVGEVAPPPPDPKAPTAADDRATTNAGTPTTIDVAANDSDPDGDLDPGSVTVTRPPANGTARAVGAGAVSYAPAAGFAGVDSFGYRIADLGGRRSNEATVTVEVRGTEPTPDILNEYGIGKVAYEEAVRTGHSLEAGQLAKAAREALSYLIRGGTPAGAEAKLRNVRSTFSGNWGVWETRVEDALRKAIATHGGGGLVYRDYMLEIASGLEAAAGRLQNKG